LRKKNKHSLQSMGEPDQEESTMTSERHVAIKKQFQPIFEDSVSNKGSILGVPVDVVDTDGSRHQTDEDLFKPFSNPIPAATSSL
jgi:hypothetical protein